MKTGEGLLVLAISGAGLATIAAAIAYVVRRRHQNSADK